MCEHLDQLGLEDLYSIYRLGSVLHGRHSVISTVQ